MSKRYTNSVKISQLTVNNVLVPYDPREWELPPDLFFSFSKPGYIRLSIDALEDSYLSYYFNGNIFPYKESVFKRFTSDTLLQVRLPEEVSIPKDLNKATQILAKELEKDPRWNRSREVDFLVSLYRKSNFEYSDPLRFVIGPSLKLKFAPRDLPKFNWSKGLSLRGLNQYNTESYPLIEEPEIPLVKQINNTIYINMDGLKSVFEQLKSKPLEKVIRKTTCHRSSSFRSLAVFAEEVGDSRIDLAIQLRHKTQFARENPDETIPLFISLDSTGNILGANVEKFNKIAKFTNKSSLSRYK